MPRRPQYQFREHKKNCRGLRRDCTETDGSSVLTKTVGQDLMYALAHYRSSSQSPLAKNGAVFFLLRHTIYLELGRNIFFNRTYHTFDIFRCCAERSANTPWPFLSRSFFYLSVAYTFIPKDLQHHLNSIRISFFKCRKNLMQIRLRHLSKKKYTENKSTLLRTRHFPTSTVWGLV